MPWPSARVSSFSSFGVISCRFMASKPSSFRSSPAIRLASPFFSPFSTMSSPSVPRAPWRDLLTSHLDQTPGYEFMIATVGYDAQNRPVPRVRTCGCRGFFPELKLHPSGQKDMDQQVEDGGNPECYESDMLSFTTDIRMEKLPQLESSGNAVEAMFWLKDLMMQWRIKGRALSIGNPRGEDGSEKVARAEIGRGLRLKSDAIDSKSWTWEKAVTKYFANHSPIMRGMFPYFLMMIKSGSYESMLLSLTTNHIVVHLHAHCSSGSFKAPSPGQPRSQEPSDPSLGLGHKITDLHDPVARNHFRVVVIVPEEVECLDLSDQANIRRWKWVLVGTEDGRRHWVEAELWP